MNRIPELGGMDNRITTPRGAGRLRAVNPRLWPVYNDDQVSNDHHYSPDPTKRVRKHESTDHSVLLHISTSYRYGSNSADAHGISATGLTNPAHPYKPNGDITHLQQEAAQ